MTRKNTRPVMAGKVQIGGGADISVQSMTNTKTEDHSATIDQILRLEEYGCDIVRVAVPDMQAAKTIAKIKVGIHIPLVADIHFDYRLALESMAQGVDKIRLNPGNIGSKDRVTEVVKMAKKRCIPIRIGVNGGSVSRDILRKHGSATPQALVESAAEHIEILEQLDFHDIVVSLKTSDVPNTISAYELFSARYDYPLHVGITEAGTVYQGTITSAVGIGSILSRGIGDTLRVSLTGDSTQEVKAGIAILKSLGLRNDGVKIVSCPTCGRCNVDLISIADQVEKAFANEKRPLKIAVMGCAVNGPGEAKDADFGVACGKGEGLLFQQGEIVKKVPEHEIVTELLKISAQFKT